MDEDLLALLEDPLEVAGASGPDKDTNGQPLEPVDIPEPEAPISTGPTTDELLRQLAQVAIQERQPQAPQQQQLQQWVDPIERPDVQARFKELHERQTYDADAALELQRLQAGMEQERSNRRFQEFQQAQDFIGGTNNVLSGQAQKLRSELGDSFDEGQFNAYAQKVQREVFGGNAQTFALAARAPEFQAMLADAAVGASRRDSRSSPGQKAAPKEVRSGARNTESAAARSNSVLDLNDESTKSRLFNEIFAKPTLRGRA